MRVEGNYGYLYCSSTLCVLYCNLVIYQGLGIEALTLLLMYFILTAIALIDIDTKTIPPILNVGIAVLGILSIWSFPGPTIIERIIGIFCMDVIRFMLSV